VNSKWRNTLMLLAACLISVTILINSYDALVKAGAEKSGRPDYQGYDLNRPWFDGKYWDWFRDMFNQASIKPQEEGTVQAFPEDSVPRSGVEPFIPPTAMVNGRLARDVMPVNPKPSTPDSVVRGKVLYETYCGVCHGNTGEANTAVTKKGMPAPPIKAMLSFLTEPHLYNKILYGGPIMPAYGFQTSRQDRWDMVNYLKSPQFGKGGSQ